MPLPPEDTLLVLQRFVDNFPRDMQSIREALADASTPDEARRFLVGGIQYAFDMLDIFPDHHKGIGMADDAIVLRLAARLARGAGASHPAVDALATDANLVMVMFDELAEPLEKLVAQFPERDVRGRNAAAILASKDTRTMFDADIGREIKRFTPHPIGGGDKAKATKLIAELRSNIQHTLKRAGLV